MEHVISAINVKAEETEFTSHLHPL